MMHALLFALFALNDALFALFALNDALFALFALLALSDALFALFALNDALNDALHYLPYLMADAIAARMMNPPWQ